MTYISFGLFAALLAFIGYQIHQERKYWWTSSHGASSPGWHPPSSS